jgi:uncharacterized protein with PIN domain
MIVVDSSALCAVFFNEPEKSAFQAILDGDERCMVSAVNAFETACVLRGKLGQAAVVEFWQWLADNRLSRDEAIRTALKVLRRGGVDIDRAPTRCWSW